MTAWTRLLLAAVLAAALQSPAGAQDLVRLFPEEADVYTTSAGLERLPLPPAVIAACAPDLGDLRLFDASGNEVPYLVDPGMPSGVELRERVTAEARVVDLSREEIPREDGKSWTREAYRVRLPEGPPVGDGWTLVFDSARRRFVRGVEVQGVDAGGSQAVLVPRASLVRLGQPLVDRDRIPLPRFEGPEILLTIEGEEGFFLEPTLRFESDRKVAPGSAAEVPLRVLTKHTEKGRTVLEVERPPALVASRLRLATSTSAFDRAVRVSDVAPDGGTRGIGRGRVVRAPLPNDPSESERLEIEVGRARGERLRIEIDDGDSPPLVDLRVVLVTNRPALLFALPAASKGAAGVLRFGGGRAYAPSYDIADLFRDAVAASAHLLAHPSALPVTRLGPIRANPLFDASPALAPLMKPGVPVEVDAWRWQRSLSFPASPEGLVRIRLAPDDLAHALASRADFRIVDAEGRQWPYVFAPAFERVSVPLGAGRPRTKEGKSTWRMSLPVTPLEIDLLVLHTGRPVLNRPYRLITRDASDREVVLARGTLTQDLRRPGPLEIDLPPTRVESLDLEVEDGDDAPIEIEGVESMVALPSLLVAAPHGVYTLLAGNPDAERPQYEIERARGVLLDLRTAPATGGPAGENRKWTGTPGGTARQRQRLQQIAIWSAVGLAVIVLLGLTLRIARRAD